MKKVLYNISSLVLEEFNIEKNKNGYLHLNNGLLIQWGFVSPHNDGTLTSVTFHIKYKNIYNIQCSLIDTVNNGASWTTIHNISETGFKIDTNLNALNKMGIYWFAIGDKK